MVLSPHIYSQTTLSSLLIYSLPLTLHRVVVPQPLPLNPLGTTVCAWVHTREYWMIYRRPGFLAVVWFGSSPTPLSHEQVSLFLSLPVCCRSSLLTGEGERGGRGTWTKLYDREKAWHSINQSILSGPQSLVTPLQVTFHQGFSLHPCSRNGTV